MITADFNHNDFEKSAQRALDEKLLVKFFYKTRPDKAKTLEEGRPVFAEVEYIDIKVAGSGSGGACRPARPADIERFPMHYQAFKNRIEAPIEGTPLAEWPVITRSLVEQFAFMNIKTVEQLADLSDTYASQIMGGHGFKQKAKDFLEYAANMKEETDKVALKRENAELRALMALLTAKVDALTEDVPVKVNGGGREETEVKTSHPTTALDTVAVKPPAKKKKKRVIKKKTAKKKD